jgi:hypothetical protein
MKFQQSNSSSKNGVKMSEEGSYLYLKRQSEGILMSAKCWFSSKRVNLYEGGAHLRVLGMD